MKIPHDPISSPCMRNCCLDEEDVCVGCFRLLSEIVGWADADNAVRQAILDNTDARRAAYREKYKHSTR